jgi:hypothetical protein
VLGAARRNKTGLFPRSLFFALFTPSIFFAPSRFFFRVSRNFKTVPSVARGITGHNGWVNNNTRNETWHLQGYPVHYSVFVFFVSVFSLSSTLFVVFVLSLLFLHYTGPYLPYPYTNRRSSFSTSHVAVPFLFLFATCCCSPGTERNGILNGTRTYFRRHHTCRRGPGWRDPTWVAQVTGSRLLF